MNTRSRYEPPQISTLDASVVLEAMGPASAGYPMQCQMTNVWAANYCGDWNKPKP